METKTVAKPGEEKGHASPESHPRDRPPQKTGRATAAGLPLFLQRSAISPANPSLVQRQVEDEEIEEPLEEPEEEAPVQAKLTVDQPGDVYEQEADRVAEQVVRKPTPAGQPEPAAERSGPAQGAGQALPNPARRHFESHLGHDLSGVRVHTGHDEAQAARSLSARAFTSRQDIVFGAGQYQPSTPQGQRLLAHELVHVVQQRAAPRLESPHTDSSARVQTVAAPGTVQRSPLSDEMARVWTEIGKGEFFDRLRWLDVFDPDLWDLVDTTLVGDDHWLACNILIHGPEARWPIHLRVEREMKGWSDSGGKSAVFDILRAVGGAEAGNTALTEALHRVFAEGSDDLWLAEAIQLHGPEPLWPVDLLTERHLRATDPARPWEYEPGNIEGLLTWGDVSVPVYFFPGRSERRALVIGGVHGSELEGIEAARQLMENLRYPPSPFFTVIVVPELFPENARRRREREGASAPALAGSNLGRFTELSRCPPTTRYGRRCVDPNRQFPTPGQTIDPANPVDHLGREIEPENVVLVNLIQRFQPERVASAHAIHDRRQAGIFTDPRTDVHGNLLPAEFNRDWNLALSMAEHAQGLGAAVPANRAGTPRATAMYRGERVPTVDRPPTKPSRPEGASLGDWGSQEIRYPDLPSGQPDPRNRPAMTIITIEIQQINRVNRAEELRAFTSSLRDIFLEDPSQVPAPTAGAR